MSKKSSFESTPVSENLPDVLMIGGTFAPKQSIHVYQPLLDAFNDGSELPSHDRFFKPKDLGLGHAADTLSDLEERIAPVAEELVRSGRPLPIIAGHSQGALYAANLAVNYGSGAVLLAGVQKGVDESFATSQVLKRVVGNSPVATDIVMGSEFMQDHLDYVGTKMPANVRVHAIAPTYDQVLGMKPQFGLELPEDHEQPIEWWESSSMISLGRAAIRKAAGVPETAQNLGTRVPSEHLSILFSTGVRHLIRNMRQEIAETHDPVLVA